MNLTDTRTPRPSQQRFTRSITRKPPVVVLVNKPFHKRSEIVTTINTSSQFNMLVDIVSLQPLPRGLCKPNNFISHIFSPVYTDRLAGFRYLIISKQRYVAGFK